MFIINLKFCQILDTKITLCFLVSYLQIATEFCLKNRVILENKERKNFRNKHYIIKTK